MNKSLKMNFWIAILALIGTLLFLKTYQKTILDQNTNVENSDSKSNQLQKMTSNSISEDHNKSGNTSVDSFKGFLNQQEFMNWINKESFEIEKSSVSPEALEIKYLKVVKVLGSIEMENLKSIALDLKAPVRERIFSVYIMGLVQQNELQAIVESFVLSPLNNWGEVRPHSVDEVGRAQELSLRQMQIEKWFERAKNKDLLAIDSLKKTSQQSSSAILRSYAQRKLKELGL
jgi:hypothetical protein